MSSLGTTAAHHDHPGNEPLNAWFLSGVFSSPEAFQGYDKLFTPEHQSSPSAHCHRLEQADADDEEGGQFVNTFPLLQEKIGEPWTLNDLTFSGLPGSKEQFSRPEFVAVGFRIASFSLQDAQDMVHSTYVVHYTQLSLKPTWTVHPLSFHLL
jgi:hypothetical protein